jgi:hypothetical protein
MVKCIYNVVIVEAIPCQGQNSDAFSARCLACHISPDGVLIRQYTDPPSTNRFPCTEEALATKFVMFGVGQPPQIRELNPG